MKLIGRALFIAVILLEWNFILGDKIYVNTTPKQNRTNQNICACKCKENALFELFLRHTNCNQEMKSLVLKKQSIY